MSTIEWTEETWNPTLGCSHHSKWGECDNCYAETLHKRWLENPRLPMYNEPFNIVKEQPSALDKPRSWKGSKVVFVNSMSDLFHKDVSLSFIKKAFQVMNETPQHTYQILTKRDALLAKYSEELNWTDNIWMGVSVGAQGATRRIANLRKCQAKNKFLSVEPLIGEITDLPLEHIDWVIVGGESGPNAREMKAEWVELIRDMCETASVPFFFKQWGDKKSNPDPTDPTINKMHRYHAKGGCMLNGKLYLSNPSLGSDELPEIEVLGDSHLVMREIEGLKTIWEFESYLPFMEDNKYKELKADIRKNGLTDPILYWTTPEGEKLVVEGHTRMRACKELGKKKIPSKEIKEDFGSIDEIKLWMVRHQLQRRNLSNTERVMYAYQSKDTIEELAKENLSKAGKGEQVNKSIDTYTEIAKLAGVGRTSVVRYHEVVSKGSDKLKKDLHAGRISISAAREKVKDITENEIEAKPKQEVVVHDVVAFKSLEEGVMAFKDRVIDELILTRDPKKGKLFNKQFRTRLAVYFESTEEE